ncbi:hypothetical protein GCM10028857_12530 [Salinarchaeum chitinilyticum]
MSNGSPDPSQDDVASPPHSSWARSARHATAAVGGPVRAIAFWSATLLPFVYVPLLLLGLDTRRRAWIFATLLFAHVLALLLGRSYGAE